MTTHIIYISENLSQKFEGGGICRATCILEKSQRGCIRWALPQLSLFSNPTAPKLMKSALKIYSLRLATLFFIVLVNLTV